MYIYNTLQTQIINLATRNRISSSKAKNDYGLDPQLMWEHP